MNAVDVAQGAVVIVFALAALSKLRTADARFAFRAQLATYGLRSRRAKLAASVLIPTVEAVVSAVTAVDRVRSAGLVASVLLLVTFTGASLYRAREFPAWRQECGCFGSHSALPLAWQVGANSTLAVIVVAGLVDQPTTAPLGDRSLGLGLGVVIGAAIVFAGTIHAHSSRVRRGARADRPHIEKVTRT